jgi:FdrA protein
MKDYKILKNTYFDSVTLMSTTVQIKKQLELKDLVMFMGTDMNKELIASVGLYQDEMNKATPNDLIIAVSMKEAVSNWADEIIARMQASNSNHEKKEISYKTIQQANQHLNANLAVISVPGVYAAHEAYKALDAGMHVMLFSDNVSIEDEINLKKLGIKKDLLVMGPDCGTAIINGKGLCFANTVNSGKIGLVAASGTGLQEVTVIIDRFGGGITQAIGVGGRDLSKEVGGLMMLKGIDVLEADEKTEVIVLISKPPHKEVLAKLMNRLEHITKPVVLCLLDSQMNVDVPHIHFVTTLTEAATKALNLTSIQTPDLLNIDETLSEEIEKHKILLAKSQTKIKGLYCGGTLTAEALSVLRPNLKDIQSNVAKKEEEKMNNPLESKGHNLVDLGDDVFTQGKPHPMIEPTIRFERILQEATMAETAVILLDFELGLGSHADPVGISLETIKEAQNIAKEQGRHIVFVCYVCGTDKDQQGLIKSEQALHEIGCLLGKTNAHSARIASALLSRKAVVK